MAKEIGLALRYGVFSPSDVARTVELLDKLTENFRVFIPDGRTGYESLQTVSAILTMTRRVRAGSGGVRLMEHDPSLLARRIQTIQAFSSNRFFLGIGTGYLETTPETRSKQCCIDSVRSEVPSKSILRT